MKKIKEHRIKLVMEGLPKDDGNIRLTDFIFELERFLEVSRRAEELISGTNSKSIYYKVVDLTHSSPASITLEACPKDIDYDIREDVYDEIINTIQILESGEEIKDFEHFSLIESLKNLTDPVGKRVSNLWIERNDNAPIKLTQEFNAKVNLFVIPEESCTETFRGMLNLIDIHGEKMVFAIFPEIGPRRIQCTFPEELFEEAKMALGNRVEVYGTFNYRINAPYPHTAEVKKLTILPSDDELPTFNDIIGIDPDLTGGLSSEDYIRKIRHES